MKRDEWAPDFGPALFVPSWGATVTGARKFLVAYNVNLIGTKEQAHRIALDIREQGRGKDQVHAGSEGGSTGEVSSSRVSNTLPPCVCRSSPGC